MPNEIIEINRNENDVSFVKFKYVSHSLKIRTVDLGNQQTTDKASDFVWLN